MSRNQSAEAIVLAVREQGENNRSVTLLSPEDGLYYATLYGGAKSKMRALVSPFNRGRIWLYKDETKHSIKITDFDVTHCPVSFRESLFKSWASLLAAETVIKTRAAGSFAECWRLLNGFLDGMDLSDEAESRLGLIRFIWRYLALLGVKPHTSSCAWCGKSFIKEAFSVQTLHERAVYSEAENGFICTDCLSGSAAERTAETGRSFILGKEALTYLEAVTTLEPKQVRRLSITAATITELKALSYHLLEEAAGSRLSALQSGIGIL
ncbi:MAG: DNA repair protein RecO [Treponema sp.]|nr:DNA repair protein RecO [Treponema sp.]